MGAVTMSYRNLRNFTEMLRSLGYPRLISIENFKAPNLQLVAEILKWLIHRYDYNVVIPTDTETEQDRVIFIKSIAQFIATKAYIKLNTKRLYMADGYAVKEMIKFTQLLYNAMKETTESQDHQASGDHNINYFTYTAKTSDLKAIREISGQVTKCGANLYELLSNELELRHTRLHALQQPLDINVIEKQLRETIKKTNEEIKKTLNKLDNVAADEANLEAKINKRKNELERSRKRLSTLQNVRPAFMDDFERLEEELKVHYENYLLKFRNMSYLEHQMEQFKRLELIKSNENENLRRKIQHRLKEEEKNVILNDPFNANEDGQLILDDDDDDDDDSDSSGEMPLRDTNRPANPIRTRANAGGVTGIAAVGGSMYRNQDSDDSLSSSDDVSDNDDEIIISSQRPMAEDEDGVLDDEDMDDDDF